MTFPYKYQRGDSPHPKNEEDYNSILQEVYMDALEMTERLKILTEQICSKAEFCKSIYCEFYPLVIIGDTSNCKNCKAYKFHKYITNNFKLLERKQ